MSNCFPAKFAGLEQFAAWALPTERERNRKKDSSSLAEVRAFYDALLPVLPEALDHLAGFEVEALPDAERRLLYLCLSMVEASMAIEMFEEVNPPYLMSLDRFVPTHDDWAR